jgi:hypothetical protein
MPGVPYTGQYEMFNTGSDVSPVTSSIRGAQKHNAGDQVDSVTQFSNNITASQIPFYDNYYAGNITSLSQISASLQWRGYPAEVGCYKCGIYEITDPGIVEVELSASTLDPQVSFNVTLAGTMSPNTGSVVKSGSIGSTLTAFVNNIGLGEQFLGWSYSADGSAGYISTSTSLSITVPSERIIIFGVAKLSDRIGGRFCYYGSSTHQNQVCESCPSTTTVYFQRNLYNTASLDDLIWYSDPIANTFSPTGQYRAINTVSYRSFFGSRTKNIIDETIYFVTGSTGEANIYKTCNEFLTC